MIPSEPSPRVTGSAGVHARGRADLSRYARIVLVCSAATVLILRPATAPADRGAAVPVGIARESRPGAPSGEDEIVEPADDPAADPGAAAGAPFAPRTRVSLRGT